MVFLDSNVVIYLIEQPPGIGPKTVTRVSALLASGERQATGGQRFGSDGVSGGPVEGERYTAVRQLRFALHHEAR